MAALVCAGVAAASAGGERALAQPVARVSAVDYVLDERAPARVAEVRLTLASSRARDVRLQLGGGGWIRCRVSASAARCRVPAGEGAVEGLDGLAVVVRG